MRLKRAGQLELWATSITAVIQTDSWFSDCGKNESIEKVNRYTANIFPVICCVGQISTVSALQLTKTQTNGQNTSQLRKHLCIFDNTCAGLRTQHTQQNQIGQMCYNDPKQINNNHAANTETMQSEKHKHTKQMHQKNVAYPIHTYFWVNYSFTSDIITKHCYNPRFLFVTIKIHSISCSSHSALSDVSPKPVRNFCPFLSVKFWAVFHEAFLTLRNL